MGQYTYTYCDDMEAILATPAFFWFSQENFDRKTKDHFS